MSYANNLGPLYGWLDANALDRSRQTLFDNSAIIGTDIGVIRKENQDRVAALRVQLANRSFACVALSDGMGGMQGGAECATLTISALFNSLIRRSIENPAAHGHVLLASSTLDANQAVYESWRSRGGATLSAVLIESDGAASIVNVGDSRIYGTRNGHAEVIRLTVDDNLKEAFGGEDSRLVQFMGMGNAVLPKVETLPVDVTDLLLTSDGAHYFDQNVFRTIVERADGVTRAAERLLALARWLGGPDNASIAALNMDEVRTFLKYPQREEAKVWAGSAQLSIMLSLGAQNQQSKSGFGSFSGTAGTGAVGGGSVRASDTTVGAGNQATGTVGGGGAQVSGTTSGGGTRVSGAVEAKASTIGDTRAPRNEPARKTKRKTKDKKKQQPSEQLEITISGRDKDDASNS